jgi:hypothetical protein
MSYIPKRREDSKYCGNNQCLSFFSDNSTRSLFMNQTNTPQVPILNTPTIQQRI